MAVLVAKQMWHMTNLHRSHGSLHVHQKVGLCGCHRSLQLLLVSVGSPERQNHQKTYRRFEVSKLIP